MLTLNTPPAIVPALTAIYGPQTDLVAPNAGLARDEPCALPIAELAGPLVEQTPSPQDTGGDRRDVFWVLYFWLVMVRGVR
jgi:hypothetical protein